MLGALHSEEEKQGPNTRDESGSSQQTQEQHRSIFPNMKTLKKFEIRDLKKKKKISESSRRIFWKWAL